MGAYNPDGEGSYCSTADVSTGALRGRALVSVLPNIAQLAMSRDDETPYAVSEVEKGVVQTWHIEKNDELTALSQVVSSGARPVYLSLTPDGKHLLTANYVNGSIAVLPVGGDGSLGEVVDRHQDEGTIGTKHPTAAVEGSFVISDHNGPHAHTITADPSGEFVYSTDLGLDRIYQYRLDGASGKLTPSDPPFITTSSPGAGPRHFVFAPKGDGLWLINEEASALTFYHLDRQSGLLREGKTVPALPKEYKDTSFAAGLALSNDGRRLYVASHLHNNIAHFTAQADGRLSRQENIWARGDYPRTLALDNQGQWLCIMNQHSDNITRFGVAPKDSKLTFASDYTPVDSPSQMVMSARP